MLDAFTGSGALFLEAMSRGAATGVALDLNPEVVSNLRNNLTLLQCDTAEVLRADALQHLKQTPIKGFDIG